jgi:hypothetical protein
MSWKLVRLVERGDYCISVRKLLSDSGLANVRSCARLKNAFFGLYG